MDGTVGINYIERETGERQTRRLEKEVEDGRRMGKRRKEGGDGGQCRT
jgi:hypothetical protein